MFEYIDENKQNLIDHLAECVSVKSVSAWPECRPQCQEMMDHVAKIIEDLGGSVEKCDVGMQTLADGSQIPLPNVLLGDICYLNTISLIILSPIILLESFGT